MSLLPEGTVRGYLCCSKAIGYCPFWRSLMSKNRYRKIEEYFHAFEEFEHLLLHLKSFDSSAGKSEYAKLRRMLAKLVAMRTSIRVSEIKAR